MRLMRLDLELRSGDMTIRCRRGRQRRSLRMRSPLVVHGGPVVVNRDYEVSDTRALSDLIMDPACEYSAA